MSEELLVNMEGNEEHFPNRDGIIRYGDHITIKHKKTKRFLASTDQGYLWGSFLQKVFTLEEISHECYWIVLPTVESEEEMNTEVNWNDFVRLKHVFTRSNLHSEDFESMVISEQEVSAYGVRGQTDENDVWIVRAANDQRDDVNKRRIHVYS
ncbi:MIR motif-containing protein [Sporodiniella umbellata]|nr:MIR motif-containing protein [Sporodiniella umbellata]